MEEDERAMGAGRSWGVRKTREHFTNRNSGMRRTAVRYFFEVFWGG